MNKKLMYLLNGLASAFRKYPDSNPTDKQTFKDVSQAHDQIIELWKECLPPERISTDKMGYTSSEDDGFNQAITQAQKNMEERDDPKRTD